MSAAQAASKTARVGWTASHVTRIICVINDVGINANDRRNQAHPRQAHFCRTNKALTALVFGVMTLYSGGSVLFIDGVARAGAGKYVPFVLWFNFIAGFAYILAGTGLYLWRAWAIPLAMMITGATLLVFAGLDLHILLGGEYEPRTLGAMTLRSTLWLMIAFCPPPQCPA